MPSERASALPSSPCHLMEVPAFLQKSRLALGACIYDVQTTHRFVIPSSVDQCTNSPQSHSKVLATLMPVGCFREFPLPPLKMPLAVGTSAPARGHGSYFPLSALMQLHSCGVREREGGWIEEGSANIIIFRSFSPSIFHLSSFLTLSVNNLCVTREHKLLISLWILLPHLPSQQQRGRRATTYLALIIP